MGYAKLKILCSPSSCSPALWRESAQSEKTEQPSAQGRMENSQCLCRRSHRHPTPAPSPRLPPQSGEGLGWWPQGDLAAAVSIQLGFRSQGPPLSWGLQSQGPGPDLPWLTEGEQAVVHVAARDETQTKSPTSALQHGLGFPAHTRQLSGQSHRHPYTI